MIGTTTQCFENIPCLFIGRFIYGLASGILSVASPRMVDEYVPIEWFSTCGPVFSFALNIGTLLGCFSASVLPSDESSIDVLAENWSWRYVYGFPIICYIYILFGMISLVRTDTPKFLMQFDSAKANEAIKTIY